MKMIFFLFFSIFLTTKGGNPNKTNARKETCLHCVCMESNAQSLPVCKRRADCLTHLLKWRGATLAEGQVEKINLAAQDEVKIKNYKHSIYFGKLKLQQIEINWKNIISALEDNYIK